MSRMIYYPQMVNMSPFIFMLLDKCPTKVFYYHMVRYWSTGFMIIMYICKIIDNNHVRYDIYDPIF